MASAATGSTLAAWSVRTDTTANVFQSLSVEPPADLQVELSCSAAAVALRAVASATSSGNKPPAPNVSLPAGVQAGDLLIAHVVAKATTTAPSGSGWNLVREDAVGTTLFSAVFAKVADASEPTSYAWTSGTDRWMVGISAWDGVDLADPITAHDGASATAGTQISAPSVTTTAANQQVVALFAQMHAGALTPAGTLWDATSSGGGAAANIRGAGHATVFPDPGGTGAMGVSGQNGAEKIGQRLALKPAAAGLWATVSWTATALGADGHEVTRSRAGQTEAVYAVTPATLTLQEDGPLESAMTYDYAVRTDLQGWLSSPVTTQVTTPAGC